MAPSTPKHVPPPRLHNSDAEFSWPPPDEELAQCFDLEIPETNRAPTGVEDVPAMTSATACDAASDNRPADSRPGPLPVMAGESAGSDDSTTPDVAVAERQSPPDGTQRGAWAAEIANLQALIEALTEQVEWRIPNATRR
jgi:hypothetical protein